MKKGVVLSLIAASLLLAGCKTELEVNTNYSELKSQPLHALTALTNVEIAGCSSHEDSRKPSDSLIKIQQMIPNVFKGAKYKECYTRKMNSFASFEIPLGVGTVDANTKYENDLNIIYQKDGSLLAQANKDFYKRFRQFLKDNMISDLEMKISVAITNDTGDDLKLNCFAAYVDDVPCSIGNTTFKQNSTLTFVLSDVSSDAILMKDRKGDRVLFASETKQ